MTQNSLNLADERKKAKVKGMVTVERCCIQKCERRQKELKGNVENWKSVGESPRRCSTY